MQKTLIVIKHKTVERDQSEEILSWIKSEGFKVEKTESVNWVLTLVQEFYQEHENKKFYPGMCNELNGKAVIVAVLSKDNAIADMRKLVGHTDPQKADGNTIRGKYGADLDDNVIHASDSEESYNREYNLLFKK